MTDLRPVDNDRLLLAAVRTRLVEAPGLKDVHAVVNDGVVILTGQVREQVDIRRSVLIAQNVDGVSDVREELKVVGGGEEEPYFDPVEGISARIPTTGEAIREPASIEEIHNPTTLADDEQMVDLVKAGMDVYDSEGKKVGKIKEVRSTDFLLARFLATNYYVPYFSCTLGPNGVQLKVRGSELKDQGWASPHQETP
jgi:hypothetical protein